MTITGSVMSAEHKLLPAAFIDRDGVINEERNYVNQIGDFVFLPGAVDALRRLQDIGFLLVVVTNQAGIARGLYSVADFEQLTSHMQQELRLVGVTISGVYFCPHHPHGTIKELAIDCDCRKPRPGMMLTAAKELGIDLSKSVLVGDKLSDIKAGQSAGVPINILVESGHVCDNEARSSATTVCRDLASAAYWIEMRYGSLAISHN